MEKNLPTIGNKCVTCQEKVSSEDIAILCDLCESWEHVPCISQSEGPSEGLYEAMMSCHSKAIVFACTNCRRRGSIVKRLMQHEYESARAEDERLASARLLEQRDQTIADLQKEVERLKVERGDMHERNSRVLTAKAEPVSLLSATKLSIELDDDEVKSKLPRSQSSTDRESDAAQSLPEHSPDDHDENGSGDESRSRNRARGNRPHPPGFKELCSRV